MDEDYESYVNRTGGPAFGRSATADGGQAIDRGAWGMNLRDWFAGQALAGMMASEEYAGEYAPRTAETAYEYADAMLAARSPKQEG